MTTANEGKVERYFLYDPQGDGFLTFETAEERDQAGKEAIEGYYEEAWSEDVEDILSGVITHQATEQNRRDRPPDQEINEDGYDEEGTHWPPEIDWICDYALKPTCTVKCPCDNPILCQWQKERGHDGNKTDRIRHGDSIYF